MVAEGTEKDLNARLLMTQPSVGPMSSLALVAPLFLIVIGVTVAPIPVVSLHFVVLVVVVAILPVLFP